jgi:uncharacterized membrane protein YgcG
MFKEMRKSIILFTAFFFFTGAIRSQELVTDIEKLLTGDEVKQVDSLLQAYHKKSGNLVAVYTDSADISAKDFGDNVYASFKRPGSDDAYSFILMMSRNHSIVFSTVNKKTMPFVNQQKLVGILETGFASFREKQRGEGVIKICTKVMEFLDGLGK